MPAKNDLGEWRICGLPAVRARFERRPDSILRLYFDYPTGRKIGALCKGLAAARKIYRCVEPSELEKVGGTVHHGGIVAVVSADRPVRVRPGEPETWAARKEPVLVLDRIGNAHNLGAIARTAAFFGIGRMVLSDTPDSARPNDAAYRVAEGALEAVDVRLEPDLPSFLRALAAAGYDVAGAAVRGGKAAGSNAIGPSARALVVGNEEHGLAPEVAAVCTRLVTIPGRGPVESLNVSVAAAVLMWELMARQRQERQAPTPPRVPGE